MIDHVICAFDSMCAAEGGLSLLSRLVRSGVVVGGYTVRKEVQKGDLSLLITQGEGCLKELQEGVFSYGCKPTLTLLYSALGCAPERTLAIVFTSYEASEAKGLGVKVLAVAEGDDAVTLAEYGSDIIIDTLSVIGEFDDAKSFTLRLEALEESGGESGKVRYGRNLVRPVTSTLFNIDRAVDIAIEQAIKTREHAYTPYSHFKVGAALVSAATGRVYSGCNVENSSYGASICAERNAILHAVAAEGNLGILALVVASEGESLAFPCAQCLQVLSEFSRPETQVHLVSIDGKKHEVYQFSQLLPHPFVLE